MKANQMGTDPAYPSLQELSLSNWTGFRCFVWTALAGPEVCGSGDVLIVSSHVSGLRVRFAVWRLRHFWTVVGLMP